MPCRLGAAVFCRAEVMRLATSSQGFAAIVSVIMLSSTCCLASVQQTAWHKHAPLRPSVPEMEPLLLYWGTAPVVLQ